MIAGLFLWLPRVDSVVSSSVITYLCAVARMAASQYLGPQGAVSPASLPSLAIPTTLASVDPQIPSDGAAQSDIIPGLAFIPVPGLVKTLAVFLDQVAIELESGSSGYSHSISMWHHRFLHDILCYLGHSCDDIDQFPDPGAVSKYLDRVSFIREIAALGLCMRDAESGRGVHRDASNSLQSIAKSAASSLLPLLLLELGIDLLPRSVGDASHSDA